jgi:hypothetical protein
MGVFQLLVKLIEHFGLIVAGCFILMRFGAFRKISGKGPMDRHFKRSFSPFSPKKLHFNELPLLFQEFTLHFNVLCVEVTS